MFRKLNSVHFIFKEFFMCWKNRILAFSLNLLVCGAPLTVFASEEVAPNEEVNNLVDQIEGQLVVSEVVAPEGMVGEEAPVAVEDVVAVIEEEAPQAPNPEDIFKATRERLKNDYFTRFKEGKSESEADAGLCANVAKLQEIQAAVYAVYANVSPHNGQNVHNFDGVYGKYHAELVRIAAEFNMGEVLSVEDFTKRANEHEKFPNYYLDKAQNKHNCMAQLTSGFAGKDAELLSRAVTFSMHLNDNYEGYELGLTLMHSIRDNYELHGGCYAGRRDRAFLAFLGMMDFLYQ